LGVPLPRRGSSTVIERLTESPPPPQAERYLSGSPTPPHTQSPLEHADDGCPPVSPEKQ